tara:strand:+ start:3631 stop:4680 length:1050 start_codon:yes stop_codon:yes gene_type:complete
MQELLNTTIVFISTTGSYTQAGLILGAAFFTALILLPFVDGVIKFLTRKTQTNLDDELRVALHKPVFYFVLLSGLGISVSVLPLPEGVISTAIAFIKTFIVVVISKGTLAAVKVIIKNAVESEKITAVNEQTLPLFGNISFAVILAAALYALFLVWGIDVTAWLASAGILGIAIGFAAKDTLSNLISGVFILADKPYSVGDYIVLGSGTEGIVSAVGLRSTRIRTFDDEEVTIPNGTIANEALTNKTAGPDTGRVKVAIGVGYGSDTLEVEQMLLDIANAHEKVLKDPEPSVRFTNFGESSLDFLLSCRVQDPLDVAGVQSDLHFRINDRFAESNIEIPFPQRDVHVKQ